MSPAPEDTCREQSFRLADYLALHPESTGSELAAACDLGSVTKVLSAMRRELGFGIRRGWRWVTCARGTKRRQVRTYTLLHRPGPAQQLALPLEP